MEKFLLNLPDAKKAKAVAKQEGFQPSSTAWLNTVWQNWCTYGPGYPQKNTIVFTTLSREALPARKCKIDCRCPVRKATGRHASQVDEGGDDYGRAQWPKEFVGAVLRHALARRHTLGSE
jgi:hypothetical protein